MSPLLVFSVIAGYFAILLFISFLTSRNSNSATFFTANKQSPWYLVAFGMIGASLSGVTFISVPGEVLSSNFFYFQMVLGYLLGYFIIATILMPLYYRLQLVSIYQYLHTRFGNHGYKTGAAFFLLSRTIGASFRLFLVATVLQLAFFDALNIPFAATVAITLILIWLYTYRAGIKTIVWTDTLQTLFMLMAVTVSIVLIGNELNMTIPQIWQTVYNHELSQVFDWQWQSKTFFVKQFVAGAFIAIVMTGLDQDMMQKNLTCKTLGEAQKNMFWFSLVLLPVNLLFMSLGVLLLVYAQANGVELPARTDELYPLLAINELSILVGILFLLGIIAAAFSSADSALTALTTSFFVDILNKKIDDEEPKTQQLKTGVHIGFSVLIAIVIVVFDQINDQSVVNTVFKVAGYTYGPLLGLYAFGLFTKINVRDSLIPYIAVLAPLATWLISYWVQKNTDYNFGFELLLVNGLITFILLGLAKQKKQP